MVLKKQLVVAGTLLGVLVVLSGCTGTECGLAPCLQTLVASFDYWPSGKPLEMTCQSTSPSPAINLYRWEIEGQTFEGENLRTITYRFPRWGNFQVSHWIHANGIWSEESQKTIWVPNFPPVSAFTFTPQSPLSHQVITFRSLSYDPEEVEDEDPGSSSLNQIERSEAKPMGIITYHWDFGDGTQAFGPIVTKQYQKSGNYQVTLFVIDDGGLSHSGSEVLAVINQAPIVDFSCYPKNRQDNVYVCDGRSSFDNGEIKEWKWEFHFGRVVKYGPVVEHTFPGEGRYVVSLVVKDDEGAESFLTRWIEIGGIDP